MGINNESLLNKYAEIIELLPRRLKDVESEYFDTPQLKKDLIKINPGFHSWVNGDVTPTLTSLSRLSKIFGISVSRIIFGRSNWGLKIIPAILPDAITLTYGERVSLLRRIYGLTTTEMGEIVGLSHPDFVSLENNRRKFSLKHLYLCCIYFQVSPDWILFGRSDWLEQFDADTVNFYSRLALDQVRVEGFSYGELEVGCKTASFDVFAFQKLASIKTINVSDLLVLIDDLFKGAISYDDKSAYPSKVLNNKGSCGSLDSDKDSKMRDEVNLPPPNVCLDGFTEYDALVAAFALSGINWHDIITTDSISAFNLKDRVAIIDVLDGLVESLKNVNKSLFVER